LTTSDAGDKWVDGETRRRHNRSSMKRRQDMPTTIVRVVTPDQTAAVAKLAREIWTEHYVPIIGRAQVDYMLERFQSEPAIAAQIAGGYLYYLANEPQRSIGYFAIVPDFAEHSALLSKIYILRDRRGHGVGRAIIAFVRGLCRSQGIATLWLTVNRNNAGSIAFYERTGFSDDGTLVTDIGNGFVMDDRRMRMEFKVGRALRARPPHSWRR